ARVRYGTSGSLGGCRCGGPSSAQRWAHAALGIAARAEDAPVLLGYADVVNAGLAPAHQAVLAELPQLVAVAAPPLPGGIVALVLEAHGDAVALEAPHVLAQRVVELAGPLGPQELHDLRTPAAEQTALPPHRSPGVGERDPVRLTGGPVVLGGLDLLARGLLGERRKRRTRGHGGLPVLVTFSWPVPPARPSTGPAAPA